MAFFDINKNFFNFNISMGFYRYYSVVVIIYGELSPRMLV